MSQSQLDHYQFKNKKKPSIPFTHTYILKNPIIDVLMGGSLGWSPVLTKTAKTKYILHSNRRRFPFKLLEPIEITYD